MARRRLNVWFLVIMVGIVGAAGVGAYGLRRWSRHVDPKTYIAKGRELFAKGDYFPAAQNFGGAIKAMNSQDPELYTLYGDAMYRYSAVDDEVLRLALEQWKQAIQLDQRYIPAHERMLQFSKDKSEISPRPDSFAEIQTTAQKLLDFDPTNKTARIALNTATIDGWIRGVQTDDDKIDGEKGAVVQLTKLAEEDPNNADIPYTLARAKIKRGEDANRATSGSGAPFFADADKLMTDGVKNHPDNAAMSARASVIFAQLLGSDGEARKPRMQEEIARILVAGKQATKLVKTDDPSYIDYHIQYIRFLTNPAIHKTDEAETILRDVLKAHPEEQALRLELVRLLESTSRRDEAIALAAEPAPINMRTYGVKRLVSRDIDGQIQVKLAEMRIQNLPTVNESKRKELLAQIDESVGKITDTLGSTHPMAMQLKGRVELVKGDTVGGVQTLSKVLDLTAPTAGSTPNPESMVNRAQIKFELARANIQLGQSGQAKRLLQEVLTDFPSSSPSRLELVQLLIAENALDAARQNVDILEKLAPESQDVIRVRVLTIDRVKEPERLVNYLNKVAEKTRQEAVNKAVLAAQVGKLDMSVALFERVLATSPGDPDVTALLARAYNMNGQKDKATVVVEESLAKNPGHLGLATMLKALKGATDEQMATARTDMLDKLAQDAKDPFDKAMILVEKARRGNDKEAMFTQLKEAEKLKPENPAVMELLFGLYIERRELDTAGAYAQKLAKINADKAGGVVYNVRLALARGKMAEATDQAKAYTAKAPEFFQSWLLLAQVQQTAGAYTDAVANYVLALERQSQNVDALKGLIACHYALNSPENAKHYIDTARKILPTNQEFVEAELNYETRYGNPEKAIGPRTAAVKAEPEVPQNWLSLGQAYLSVADAKEVANDKPATAEYRTKARETFDQALAKWPENDTFAQLAANIAVQMKDFAGAEKAMLTYTSREANAKRPEVIATLARFYIVVGKPAEADKTLREGIARLGPQPQLVITLADMLLTQNKTDEAIQILDSNLADSGVIRRKIEVLINADRIPAAEAAFAAATAGKPLTNDLKNLDALIKINQNKLTEAISILDDVINSDPRNIASLYYRSLARARVPGADLQLSINDLTAVRDLAPNYSDARTLLSDIYMKRNDRDSAIRELEAALRVDATQKLPRLKLLDLYSGAQPPRWNQVDRLLKDTKQTPAFVNDPELLHAEALVWKMRNDKTKAMSTIRQAVLAAPSDGRIANTFYNMLLDDRDYKGVLTVSEDYAKKDPNAWWIKILRATAKARLHDNAGAMAEFEAAMETRGAKNDGRAVNEIIQAMAKEIGLKEALAYTEKMIATDSRWGLVAASLYQQNKDMASALAVVEKMLANLSVLPPVEQDAVRRVAAQLYTVQEPPNPREAIRQYREVLAKSPTDISVLNNLAFLLAAPGPTQDLKATLAYAEQANKYLVSIGRSEPLVMDTYGWALIQNGRVDEGIAQLKEALATTTKDFADAHYHLGEAYILKNAAIDAEKELSAAQKLIVDDENKDRPVDQALKANVGAALAKARQMKEGGGG